MATPTPVDRGLDGHEDQVEGDARLLRQVGRQARGRQPQPPVVVIAALLVCSSTWSARSSGLFSGFLPASSAGLQTGNISSAISQSARSPGHWPRP